MNVLLQDAASETTALPTDMMAFANPGDQADAVLCMFYEAHMRGSGIHIDGAHEWVLETLERLLQLGAVYRDDRVFRLHAIKWGRDVYSARLGDAAEEAFRRRCLDPERRIDILVD